MREEKIKAMKFAIREIIPLIFSYVFVGIAVGILTHEASLSLPWNLAYATFIYAGSMQIVLIPLMLSGAPLYLIAFMTLFINARHIFYGFGFIEKFKKMGKRYPYMALTMTDETYSLLSSIEYPKDIKEEDADFYILFFCHILWIFSCFIGALFGEVFPFDISGIEFSATAFFLTVCINQWSELKSHIPAIIGFISALVFRVFLGADNFILPALTCSLISLLLLKDKILFDLEKTKDDTNDYY